MAEFLALLANLYLCDAITEVRHLTMPEMAECRQAEALVHAWFLPFEATPEDAPAARLAFTAWEEANPDLTADMQAAAWLSVRRTGSVLFW